MYRRNTHQHTFLPVFFVFLTVYILAHRLLQSVLEILFIRRKQPQMQWRMDGMFM